MSDEAPSTQNQKSVLLGFAVRKRGPSGRWHIQFRWGRILAVLFSLVIIGYISLTTALFFFFKEVQKFDDVKYTDMFTIFLNMKEHRAKVGDYQIEKAKEMLEDGNYRDAFTFLREGVQRSPTNLEGRLLVSEFFIYIPNMQDTDRALALLSEGLPYAHDDARYLQRYIKLLLRQQEDEEVINIAQEILAEKPSDEITELLATAAATAHLYRGNFDEAEDFVRTYDLEKRLDGLRLSARITWERGAQKAAIAKLENGIGKFNTDEPLYAGLSQYYRDRGEGEKAREYAVLRNIDAPLAVSPRVDLLYTLSLTGQNERAKNEADAILRQFRNDEAAMMKLANYATDEGLVDLARRIYEQALENDFPIAPFALLLIESHITAGDYQGAISFSEELAKERPAWLEQNMPIFNSLRAVAYYGVGNENLADIYIEQFLQQPNLRVESLMAVSRRFSQLGGDKYSRQVLKQAYENNPKNQAALSNLIEIEIKTGNAAELGNYLKKLLQMRRPSVDILQQAYQKLGSDRFIFTPDRENLLIELNTVLNPQEQAG
ncbi:tetratricopeptide repeat protein [Cerasicoccus arenae]|uniref:Tetratricopeptide repeat protein n=1 Tax=Cerasicoccus arenae TaxID=424488 RepID=A0A8J3DB25_9BACT|nr:hypothetical protein [Cerasicoccus arenae]MBK1857986.1 hypothetical protein [Cerasicoccus arenae]GHB97646.1 hypothetical protein GCM10007047_11870 [Cerasicoccus arenae]